MIPYVSLSTRGLQPSGPMDLLVLGFFFQLFIQGFQIRSQTSYGYFMISDIKTAIKSVQISFLLIYVMFVHWFLTLQLCK